MTGDFVVIVLFVGLAWMALVAAVNKSQRRRGGA